MYAALDKMEDEQLLWPPADHLRSASLAQDVSRTPMTGGPLAPAKSGAGDAAAGDAGAAVSGVAQRMQDLLAENAMLKAQLAAKDSEFTGMKNAFDTLVTALAPKK